jgi:hypothetical protein
MDFGDFDLLKVPDLATFFKDIENLPLLGVWISESLEYNLGDGDLRVVLSVMMAPKARWSTEETRA